MKTVAIIQARMGSTRLPGKILRELCGQTVLAHVLMRTAASGSFDEIVIATTDLAADDVIAAEATHHGARVFRGSEQDVLSRYYFAARDAQADAVVRITSDCPLLDPTVVQEMVNDYAQHTPDYLSNTINRSFPRGLDCEIFSFANLETAWQEAQQPFEREHVTPYFYLHPERFTIRHYVGPENLADHRWTLDTPEDWALIEAIYASLHETGKIFTTQDVLTLLAARPELIHLNAHVEQKKLQG